MYRLHETAPRWQSGSPRVRGRRDLQAPEARDRPAAQRWRKGDGLEVATAAWPRLATAAMRCCSSCMQTNPSLKALLTYKNIQIPRNCLVSHQYTLYVYFSNFLALGLAAKPSAVPTDAQFGEDPLKPPGVHCVGDTLGHSLDLTLGVQRLGNIQRPGCNLKADAALNTRTAYPPVRRQCEPSSGFHDRLRLGHTHPLRDSQP